MDEQETRVQRDEVVADNGVTERRQTVERSSQVDSRVLVARVIWWIAGVVIALLALRVILMLFGANEGSPFVGFIYAVSQIFAWPFYGIFPQPAYGASALDSASLVAMIVYALIAWGLARLTTLTARHSEVA